MKVFRGFNHPGVAPACALTIGNFDGVHRGHQAMLALLRGEAQQRGVPSCVLTFEPHPRRTDGKAAANAASGNQKRGRSHLRLCLRGDVPAVAGHQRVVLRLSH